MKRDDVIQFVKFCIIGAGNTLINLAVLYFLTSIFGWYYLLSEILAFTAGTVNSFVWNSVWTFKSRTRHVRKYFKFLAINVVSLGVNLLILYLLTNLLEVHYLLSELVASFASLVVNFAGNKMWTFGPQTEHVESHGE